MSKPQPPDSNRGVQYTYDNGLIALVDWVSVTFPYMRGSNVSIEDLPEYSAKEYIRFLGFDINEFKEMPHSLNGYKKMLQRGNIKVLYDGTNVDMGIHVIMSGQGCREFENEYADGWPEFFRRVFVNEGHFTRLDLAFDDFKGFFTVEQVAWRLENGLASSRFKSYRMMKKGNIEDGSSQGLTVYLGSPQSDIQIRIYDKRREREGAGKEVTVESWVRTEMQLAGGRADAAAIQIINECKQGAGNIGLIMAGVLKNYVNFYEKKTDDSNKSRWPVWKKWDKFLGEAVKIKLTLKAPDKTIEKRRAWIDNQTSKTLGKLFLAYESDMDWLVDTLNRGMELLEDRDFDEIETYKRNKKLIDKFMLEDRLERSDQQKFDSFEDYLQYRYFMRKRIDNINNDLGG